MIVKYWEILKGLLPFLVKLDGATRVVGFIIVTVGISSYYLVDYVNAKHVEVKAMIEKEQLNLKTNLSDKMDAQQKVLVALMQSLKDDAMRTREDVKETRRNVIQIYQDLSVLKKTN